MVSPFLFAIILSYLFGSIPFGLLIAKSHGKDLRSIGSGNIGATNVARALGRKWAYICFVLDLLKGFLPTLTIMSYAKSRIAGPDTHQGLIALWLWLAVGCSAIIGHVFPVYLKFKGGKGVATSFGVALGIWPFYTICALAAISVWMVILKIWRYISLASIIASVSFPVTFVIILALEPTWQLTSLWPLVVTASAIPLMVIGRHRGNIKRLLDGTESKIKTK